MLKIVDNYTLNEYLGKGEYGKVYKATNIDTKFDVAVKMIPLSKFEEIGRLVELTKNQLRILKVLEDNINVINFVEMIKTNRHIYLVYQFCEGGTLQDVIRKRGPLPQKQALKLFKQLINAFKALNESNILHRDVKPNNIFFKSGHLKLADFGFCKQLKNNDDLTQTSLGSPLYMAPEVLNGDVYGSKADLWSVGVVLYEMLFGKCPYGQCNIKQLINIYNNDRSKIPMSQGSISISPITQNMLRRMLQKDQFKRISWQDFFYQYSIDQYGGIIKKQKDFQYDLMKLIKKNSSMSSNGNRSGSENQIGSEKNIDQRYSKFDWSKITQKNSSIHSQQLNPIHHRHLGSIDEFVNLKKKVKQFQLEHQKRVQLSAVIQQMLNSPKDYFYSDTICYFLIYNLQDIIQTTLPQLLSFNQQNKDLLNKNSNQANIINKMIVVFRNQASSLTTKINSIKINLINGSDFSFNVTKYPNTQIRQKQTNRYIKKVQQKLPGITDINPEPVYKGTRQQMILFGKILWGVATIKKQIRKDKQLNILSIKPENGIRQVGKLINRLIVFLNA